MRKKMITIALAGMMAFSLAACGAGGDAATKGPEITTEISKDTAAEEKGGTEEAAKGTTEKAEEGKKPEASKPAEDQKDTDSKDADQDTLVKNTVSKKEETSTATKKPAITTTEKPSTTTKQPASTTTKKPTSTTTKKPASTTTKKPATDKKKPVKPAAKPSDTKKAVKISTILKAVQKAYGDDYVPNMDVDQATLAEKYGVKKSWYTEAAAQVSMISMHVDTFIAVKAKPGKADEVEKALNAYRDSLIADTLQYPMNKARIPGSRVDRIGDYVFFTLLGKVDSSEEEKGEEAILAATKKECKIAYTTISKLLK